MKEFADDNVKFDKKKNGRKFSKRVENPVEKGEIARYEPFLLFPQGFQKTCTADTQTRKNQGLCGKELNEYDYHKDWWNEWVYFFSHLTKNSK